MTNHIFTKKFAVILIAALLFSACNFSAFAAEDGMYRYRTTADGKAVITEYLGEGNATVTLPETLGGYPVCGVDANAFGKVTNDVKPHAEIQKIIIPASITEIGDRAFAGTSWFDNKSSADENGFLIVNHLLLRYLGNSAVISVPRSVNKINVGAFEKNDTITEVALPAEVTIVDDYAFYKCTALSRALITGKIEKIGKSAFYGCEKLQTVEAAAKSVLPDSLKVIGDNAFYGCGALSGTLALGNGIENIGTYAFANCESLDGIRLPDTVAAIGSYALGFKLVKRGNDYYPEKNNNFTIYVTHQAKEDPTAEQEALKTYSKTQTPIYQYAANPDGNGYFSEFNMVWDRLAYPFALGDVNNDGKINAGDARALLRHAAKLNLLQHEDDLRAADINADGKINSVDARKALRHAAKLELIA